MGHFRLKVLNSQETIGRSARESTPQAILPGALARITEAPNRVFGIGATQSV
jgi:hypothetical protein